MGTNLKAPEQAHTSPEYTQDPHEGFDDTDSTATNSSDEFDWSEDEEAKADKIQPRVGAKRGRRLWLAFVKLARPVRVFLVSLIGIGISITPLLVVDFRFPNNPAKVQVQVWSLWFTIIWATSCITYVVVDLIPRSVITVTWLFGGKIERLKVQVEVCTCSKPYIFDVGEDRPIVVQLIMAVKAWLKLLLDTAWALIALSILRAVYRPSGSYWTIISRVMQVRLIVNYHFFNILKFSLKALLAAAIIVFAEKLFLQFVAINFHQKALADRLEENRLGLKALDCLSNVHPVASKKPPYHKRGHKRMSSVGTIDLATLGQQENGSINNTPTTQSRQTTLLNNSKIFSSKSAPELRPKRRKKKVTSVIINQVRHLVHQTQPPFYFNWVPNQGRRSNRSICIEKLQVP